MSWTDERTDLLQRLWTAGRSATDIARDLGPPATRNSVIGKAHRMGLAPRTVPGFPPMVRNRPHRKRVAESTERNKLLVSRAPVKILAGNLIVRDDSGARSLPKETVVSKGVEMVPIEERRDSQCAAIVQSRGWLHWCCGAPVADRESGEKSHYCQQHLDAFFVPSKTSARDFKRGLRRYL